MDRKDSGESPWWQPGLILFFRLNSWIVAPLIIAIFIGKFLDKRYNTDPWLFLLSIGLAFVFSIWGIIRDSLREMKKVEKEEKK